MGQLRTDQSQRGSRLDSAERMAKVVLESALPGASLDFRAIQSDGEHDFDLTYDDGAVAAVEVTACIERRYIEAASAVHNPRRGGSIIPTARCKNSWIVFFSMGARINSVRGKIDQFLSELENAGIEDFHCVRGGRHAVQNVRVGLNIVRARAVDLGEPPIISMNISAIAGAVGAQAAIAAAEAEAWKPDIRKKLGKAGTIERHLVVYIGSRKGSALTAFHPPSTIPSLPEEITDLWLFTNGFQANQFFVWRARSGEGLRGLGTALPVG